MATPSEALSICKVLSESSRIIRSHLHHFQALTALFVFPLSLCFLVYPAIQTRLLSHPEHGFPQQLSLYRSHYLLSTLLYTALVYLFSLLATATISYSTYHGFHDEPVDLIESIKSIVHSFCPIVLTTVVASLIEVLILIPLLVVGIFVSKWLPFSSYFMLFVTSIGLFGVLTYVQVNWILAPAVVVVESKWGYAPLKRSAYLVKGHKGVAFSLMLYFGLMVGVVYWGTGFFWSTWLRGWWFLLYIIFGSLYLIQVLLLGFVAHVVLYVYCKESIEGLPIKNAIDSPLLK